VGVTNARNPRTVCWHRELPPPDAEIVGEYTLDAASGRVPATLSHRDELWDRCYTELMEHARARLDQEMHRLGGDCAHVIDESVDSRRDEKTGEAWLHGQFRYVLYRNVKNN
jgi:hypothetical protein